MSLFKTCKIIQRIYNWKYHSVSIASFSWSAKQAGIYKLNSSYSTWKFVWILLLLNIWDYYKRGKDKDIKRLGRDIDSLLKFPDSKLVNYFTHSSSFQQAGKNSLGSIHWTVKTQYSVPCTDYNSAGLLSGREWYWLMVHINADIDRYCINSWWRWCLESLPGTWYWQLDETDSKQANSCRNYFT